LTVLNKSLFDFFSPKFLQVGGNYRNQNENKNKCGLFVDFTWNSFIKVPRIKFDSELQDSQMIKLSE
jgi:hypothetical protein